ncbi:hypothetical protein JKP88DRAFT_320173 [Tribonema minus]|uniref:Uncharacterized protein n=1 Tax=Tribonema minus TaxID=303371 RepID=A0A835YWF1_9STRA|nr:hypothetical protein JKP88DRAFT_320173 [Tribonema minus]
MSGQGSGDGELHIGLKDLVNVELAEGVFTRFVAALNSHATELHSLKQQLQAKVSAESFNREIQSIDRRLCGLEQRGESMQQRLQSEVKRLQLWAMDRQAGEDLWASCRSLQQTLAAQQAALATKLERSEVQHVQHLVGRVAAVAGFMDDSKARVTALEGAVQRAHEQHRLLADSADATKQRVEALHNSLSTRASDHSVAQLERQLENLRDAVAAHERRCGELHASAAATRATLEARLREAGDAAQRERLASENRREAMADEVDAKLATKADVAICDGMWSELRAEIDCKAWGHEHRGLAERVDGLSSDQAATAKQAALAVRFVNWFSTRGEAYDHNLNAVEKQLHGMATSALSSINQRQPYSGTLRFTPADR